MSLSANGMMPAITGIAAISFACHPVWRGKRLPMVPGGVLLAGFGVYVTSRNGGTDYPSQLIFLLSATLIGAVLLGFAMFRGDGRPMVNSAASPSSPGLVWLPAPPCAVAQVPGTDATRDAVAAAHVALPSDGTPARVQEFSPVRVIGLS